MSDQCRKRAIALLDLSVCALCVMKLREIIHTLQIKFWNCISEITEGKFKGVISAWMLADTIFASCCNNREQGFL
jgi:hypothetical protein